MSRDLQRANDRREPDEKTARIAELRRKAKAERWHPAWPVIAGAGAVAFTVTAVTAGAVVSDVAGASAVAASCQVSCVLAPHYGRASLTEMYDDSSGSAATIRTVVSLYTSGTSRTISHGPYVSGGSNML